MRMKSGTWRSVVLVMAVMLVGCGGTSQNSSAGYRISSKAKVVDFSWGTFKLAKRIIDKAASGEPLNLIMDNQGTAIPISGPEHTLGTAEACAKNKARLPIVCRVAGPPLTNNAAQISELETLLASGQVDCLGIQAAGTDQFVPLINKFIAAGVPVFGFGSDNPSSERFAFFSQNEYDAGYANGVATAQAVKTNNLPIKEIAMGSGQPSGTWAQDRSRGFTDGYKSVIPDAQFAMNYKNDLPTGSSYTTQGVISTVQPYLLANPNVNLFFHTDQGVEGVGDAITNLGLVGKAWASGFNADPAQLDMVDKGIILTDMGAGFNLQDEQAITSCVNFFLNGTVPPQISYYSAYVITKDGANGTHSVAEAKKTVG